MVCGVCNEENERHRAECTGSEHPITGEKGGLNAKADGLARQQTAELRVGGEGGVERVALVAERVPVRVGARGVDQGQRSRMGLEWSRRVRGLRLEVG